MNKYEHAAMSAKIFGGEEAEYLEVHALIDSNKVVSPSIFGRFFLHHIDIGLPILEKIFGETIGKKQVLVKKLLAQHLIEDYGKVLTFTEHWMMALNENKELLPAPTPWNTFLTKAKTDPRIKDLSEDQLKEVEAFMRLETLLPADKQPGNNLVFAIFGHALGGDLAARILGPQFHGFWTSDVITGYLNCRFSSEEKNRDTVPTLLDYERYVADRHWMHSPREDQYNRLEPKALLQKIEHYLNTEEWEKIFTDKEPVDTFSLSEWLSKKLAFLSKIQFPRFRKKKKKKNNDNDFFLHRRPCNFD